MMESRPFAARGQDPPLAGLDSGAGPGGPQVRSGWSRAAYTGPLVRPSSVPHHSAPLQGATGPLRWELTSPGQSGWVLYPGITHPVYPPVLPA